MVGGRNETLGILDYAYPCRVRRSLVGGHASALENLYADGRRRMTAPFHLHQASQVRIKLEPRLVPPEKIARRLGVTPSAFRELVADLESVGFPKPLPVVGNYSIEAVDRWIDERAGIIDDESPQGAEAAMLRAIANMK
jgi:hypothetical protein